MRITFSKTPPKRALQRRGGVCDVYGGQDKAPAGASAGREARYVQIAGRSGGVWGRAPVTKRHIPLEGNVAQRQGVRRYLITKGLTIVSPFVMRCQAESNCCTWFCRPVPNHSAMAPWLGNAKIKLISQFQNKRHYASTLAYLAFCSMNSRRSGTSSPISIEKMRSASAAFSMWTAFITRLAGSIVVSQSCSADISPRPL